MADEEQQQQQGSRRSGRTRQAPQRYVDDLNEQAGPSGTNGGGGTGSDSKSAPTKQINSTKTADKSTQEKQAKREITKVKAIDSASKVTRSTYVPKPGDEFLIKVYAELDEICEGKRQPEIGELDDIESLLRQTIVSQTFVRLDPNDRAKVHGEVLKISQDTSANHGVAAMVIRDASPQLIHEKARLLDFASKYGFLLLSVCLHSATFKRVLLDGTYDSRFAWNNIAIKGGWLTDYASSLELFARTRGLHWEERLQAANFYLAALAVDIRRTMWYIHQTVLDTNFLQFTQAELKKRHVLPVGELHPHEWYLPGDSSQPAKRINITYTDKSKAEVMAHQVNMNECEVILMEGGKNIWPHRGDWPVDDPRYAAFDDWSCELCTQDLVHPERCNDSRENFFDQKGIQPRALVELVDCGDRGVGVRALRNFRKGDILGEYVGQVYPYERGDSNFGIGNRAYLYSGKNGGSYRLETSIEWTSESQKSWKRGEYKSLVTDSALRGNWTRYLNHSCNSHTTFQSKNINQVHLMFVEANRDIAFGEEITVDYRSDYFTKTDLECHCGDKICTLWSVENKLKRNKMDLGTARRLGRAPAWDQGIGGTRAAASASVNQASPPSDQSAEIQRSKSEETKSNADKKAATKTLRQLKLGKRKRGGDDVG